MTQVGRPALFASRRIATARLLPEQTVGGCKSSAVGREKHHEPQNRERQQPEGGRSLSCNAEARALGSALAMSGAFS
jgi:hypothetical protein